MKTRNNRIKWRHVFVTGLFLTGIGFGLVQMDRTLFAAAKTWDGGGGDSLFSTAANWSGDTVPVDGDSLIFDVTGLGGNTTLTNDMVGLSVTGITFSGDNALGDYTLDGNELSVSGAIVESTTDDHSVNPRVPFMLMDLNLTGSTSFQGVRYGTGSITNNGNLLTLITSNADFCAAPTIGGEMIGSGALAVEGTGRGILYATNPSYTGAVTVASGSTLVTPVEAVQAAASITTTDATLTVSLGGDGSDKALATPLNLSGTLEANTGDIISGCSGAGGPGGETLTLSGDFTQTGDLVFDGEDTIVTGTYVSNGYALTTDPGSAGTITVPAEAPDTAPGAPTGLTPTVGNAQVGLSWTAPASDGGDAISDYVVQYKLSASGTWLTFADGAGTGTTATVTGLTNGSSYDFRVMAVNGVGQSTPVVTSGVTPLSDPTASDAPSGLIGTPGDSEVALDWAAPASNGGSAITDYQLQYKLSASGTWLTFADGTSTATTATVTGLTNASSYDFRVLAVNGIGNSAYDTITGVTPSATATAPVAPTQIGAATNTSNGDLVLGWTAPASNGGSPITDYLVEIKLSGDAVWSTVSHAPFTGNSFTITSGLTDGSTYDIRISAVNSVGTGAPINFLGYLYDSTTGSTGDTENANGSGNGGSVDAPNTGALNLIKNPALLIGLGTTSALLLFGLALKRRTTAK